MLAYQSYFEWKWKPFNKEFEERFRVLWEVPFECRMCRYVDGLLKGWELDKLKQVSINPENAPNRSNEEKLKLNRSE